MGHTVAVATQEAFDGSREKAIRREQPSEPEGEVNGESARHDKLQFQHEDGT